jgi:PhnB protein
MQSNIATAIEPWITVDNGKSAETFYKSAFGAEETYRLEDPEGGLILRLAVDKAGFWISGGVVAGNQSSPGPGNIRLVLIVSDPDKLYAQALAAGAASVFPVQEEYGWRLGRVQDPFGVHWEIGHPLGDSGF